MKAKILGWAAVAAALGVVYLFAMPSYRQGEPSVAGKRAPDFEIQYLGKPAHLADFKGKVLVLDFWASWCPPCVAETPSLNALQERIAGRGGLVLGISQDDDESAYERFLSDHGVNFPTYRDPAKGIAPVYGTTSFPEAYLISRDGHIARKIVGQQDWDSPDITAAINTLLASN